MNVKRARAYTLEVTKHYSFLLLFMYLVWIYHKLCYPNMNSMQMCAAVSYSTPRTWCKTFIFHTPPQTFFCCRATLNKCWCFTIFPIQLLNGALKSISTCWSEGNLLLMPFHLRKFYFVELFRPGPFRQLAKQIDKLCFCYSRTRWSHCAFLGSKGFSMTTGKRDA